MNNNYNYDHVACNVQFILLGNLSILEDEFADNLKVLLGLDVLPEPFLVLK